MKSVNFVMDEELLIYSLCVINCVVGVYIFFQCSKLRMSFNKICIFTCYLLCCRFGQVKSAIFEGSPNRV